MMTENFEETALIVLIAILGSLSILLLVTLLVGAIQISRARDEGMKIPLTQAPPNFRRNPSKKDQK